jgi:aminopeptidase N
MLPVFLVIVDTFIIITVVTCRKYNNAEEADLWEALMEQIRETPGSFLPTNVTVKQVMDSWTRQDGYPVLNVTRNYDDGSATVSQVRKSNTGMKL